MAVTFLTNEDKKELEQKIENAGSKVTVDAELSNESENPVQNKVITSEINQLKESIANLPTGDDASIPDYVIEEAEATIEKVFSHGNYGRTIRFIAISDTHEDSAESYNPQITISNQHAGQAIKYIADRIGLDFVAHLGDASSCGAWTTTYEPSVLRDDIKNINKFIFSGVRGIKTAFIAGNHDMISMNGYALLNSGAYPLFGNMCSGNKDRLGGWGYFDLDDANVRVIYLNTSDSPSSASYLALSQAQKNWLCETLIDVNAKDNADEWKVILLSHAPLDFGGVNISTDILLPYVNGGSYSGYSFANKNSAEIISNIHGHMHCFSYGYIADKIRRFCIPNACFIGANHYASKTDFAQWTDTTTYNKTANSGKDTAFSLVTIDLDSGNCYVDNYGAGIDREFSTDYKPDAQPTSISNITYSGDTTVESAIDKSKFSFTVKYSDGTTSSMTGASTVSPTTIGVVGNNSVTITYVENGVTLNGTVTIVGVAKPVVRLLNLDRNYVSGTASQHLQNNLDESKAYLNVVYGTALFNASSCTVSNVTEDGVTVKESGIGGVTVAYPIYLPDIRTNPYKIKFDYSGAGKCRTYYRYGVDGVVGGSNNLYINDTAGTSGTAEVTIPANTDNYTWLIIMFSSNTGNTKTFTNVELTKA